MAEAEDVLVDAARHATVFAQELWQRHRPARPPTSGILLRDVTRRIGLMLTAAMGREFRLRAAQAPVPPNWLARSMRRHVLPFQPLPVPATDGIDIWLPPEGSMERYRLMALRLAMRAVRGSPAVVARLSDDAVLRELFLLGEARSADAALQERFPGLAVALAASREACLARRPPLARFPLALRPFESFARAIAAADPVIDWPDAVLSPTGVLDLARRYESQFSEANARIAAEGQLLWRDEWTADLRIAEGGARGSDAGSPSTRDAARKPPRSARLRRRPDIREAEDGEDDREPGAWMVQPSAPNEAAEDPMGLQRPLDRDEVTSADEYADAVGDLPQARLVSTPDPAKEVLLSDDPPDARARSATNTGSGDRRALSYPEWDYRICAYREPGATVLVQPAAIGPSGWVERTLAQRAAMVQDIRRNFELLRARRVRLRRQLDGDAIDVDAWTSAVADYRAGLPLDQRLYQLERRGRRDMTIALLADISGSTESWIDGRQRVIDVEREALLLVCVALESLATPYSVLAFSGEGPQGVVVRSVKEPSEGYGLTVGCRIAGLEPEHYTRTGAAIRHATARLSIEPASHRLLVLLSDGKPNDVDQYEGRYGVEDMRQAVIEARLQGVFVFCLTVDRHAASYLPAVFGPHHYAMLPKPDMLPTALLAWLRRLVQI